MNQIHAWNRYLQLMHHRPESFQNTGPIHIVTDYAIVEEYHKQTGKIIGVCYESEYNILVTDLVYEQKDNYFVYERLLPAVPSGAVVCVPKFGDQYILLKQYRHSMRNYQLAFPRGYATPGIPPEENVAKETKEELGATVTHTQFIGNVIADSGLSGNVVNVFLCEIDNYGTQEKYEGITATLAVSSNELVHLIQSRQITDGYTLAACSFLFAHGNMSADI